MLKQQLVGDAVMLARTRQTEMIDVPTVLDGARNHCSIAPMRSAWRLPVGIELPFAFAEGVNLVYVPNWLGELDFATHYGVSQSQLVHGSNLALRIDFEADDARAVDPTPDPNGSTDDGRGFNERNFERIHLAAFALWLARPGWVTGLPLLHALADGGQPRTYSRLLEIHPHQLDVPNKPVSADVKLAALLHQRLLSAPRDGPVWSSAIRTMVLALTLSEWEARYPVTWIVLEALFGPTSIGELTYRISQRLALFLADDRVSARELANQVRVAYKWRSRTIHGRRIAKLAPTDSGEVSHSCETWIRESLTRLLLDPDLLEIFDGKDRDAYLDDLVFSEK